ncbi:MAG: hypothetical protein KAQ65_08885, partial [Candidatus Thorarchaeota archaeon]|nr:hypothetical protein [Candidatus Thorarchaeota archaeon]MCK5239434.1 hypothetical protein [Candidatus Thorarchaeota archaeon]
MSLAVWWKRGSKPGLILMFMGIAGFVQIPLMWHSAAYVQVLSAELQLIVALGAMVVLGGAYVFMAEAMYRWAHIMSKRKVRRRQRAQSNWITRISEFARSKSDMPAFAGVALTTCIFLMLYFVPFGISDSFNLPSWLAIFSFLDSLFVYPLAVNISAIVTAMIASYMNHKIR